MLKLHKLQELHVGNAVMPAQHLQQLPSLTALSSASLCYQPQGEQPFNLPQELYTMSANAGAAFWRLLPLTHLALKLYYNITLDTLKALGQLNKLTHLHISFERGIIMATMQELTAQLAALTTLQQLWLGDYWTLSSGVPADINLQGIQPHNIAWAPEPDMRSVSSATASMMQLKWLQLSDSHWRSDVPVTVGTVLQTLTRLTNLELQVDRNWTSYTTQLSRLISARRMTIDSQKQYTFARCLSWLCVE